MRFQHLGRFSIEFELGANPTLKSRIAPPPACSAPSQPTEHASYSHTAHAKCHSAHRWTSARPFNFCRRPRPRRRRPLSARSQRFTPPSLRLFTRARRVHRTLPQLRTAAPSPLLPPPRIVSAYTRLNRSSSFLIFLFPHPPLRRHRLRLWPGGRMWPATCFTARRRVRLQRREVISLTFTSSICCVFLFQ